MAFADRLREIMDARGVDQTALAEAVGIKSQAVSQWVSRVKTTQPVGKRLPVIAAALRVTVPELMADVGEPFGDTALLAPTLLLPHESALISSIRSMPEDRAKAILLLAGVEDGAPDKPTPIKPAKDPPRPFAEGGNRQNPALVDCEKVVPLRVPLRVGP